MQYMMRKTCFSSVQENQYTLAFKKFQELLFAMFFPFKVKVLKKKTQLDQVRNLTSTYIT